MIYAETPPPASSAQAWIPTLLSALIALLAAIMVYRNGQRANKISDRTSLSQQQLAWTQQAMTEAQAAKTEARAATESAVTAERTAKEASAAADSATRRADAAEVRLGDVTELVDRLMDWIARVVRKSHVEGIGDGASPQVQDLLRTINGGPPEVSTARLKRRP